MHHSSITYETRIDDMQFFSKWNNTKKKDEPMYEKRALKTAAAMWVQCNMVLNCERSTRLPSSVGRKIWDV